MEAIAALLGRLPVWAGSVPMWGIFCAVIIALIRVWPKLKEIGVAERAGIRDPYLVRIKELANQVQSCRDDCDQQEKELRAEIDKNKRECEEREDVFKARIDRLRDRLNNEAFQRVQSEISLVNTLISVVDAPQLRTILNALEQRQILLPQPVEVPEVDEGDQDA